MRHTFGTLLSKAGVTLRTVQAAMRHSNIDLTMNTYTDPKLLDVAGAVEALPELLLTRHQAQAEVTATTGTDGVSQAARKFAPGFAPNSDNSWTAGSIPGKSMPATSAPRNAKTLGNCWFPRGFRQSG
ncbi:MAG: tyrosine-type recombinase/integrase [Pirellulaceae bacterium]